MGETNKGLIKTSVKMNTTESLSFLLEEYRQCYEHMRHYDNTRLSLAKFTLSFYSIIATIVFAIVQCLPEEDNNDIYLSLFLFFVSFAGFLIIAMLAQNRAYFVQVARQVNSLRKELIALNIFSFQNFLYTDDSVPVPHNPKSTHILLLYFISFVNAVFFCFATFFTLSCLTFLAPLTKALISLLTTFIVFVLEMFFSIRILKNPK